MASENWQDELVSESDYLQLARLQVELPWRIDHGQCSRVHELFTDDGRLSVGVDLVGRQAILDWGREWDEKQPMPGLIHLASNQRFVYDGPDQAKGTVFQTAYLVNDDGHAATVPFAVGEDQDTFVRTPNGWRFTSRVWTDLFTR
ncbi:nuclear transport factor 2 family protein [Micromonospora musae]|uniref:nuclear transport factor 2 family protein n=1 Tax=Micromonospora musae TaxID=1894970 RepID=UPI00341A4A2C